MSDGRAQIAFVVAQRFQCLFQFGSCGVLEQIAASPDVERTHDHVRVGVHRQDQYLAMWLYFQQVFERLKAVDALHPDIEQDDVGLESLRQARQLRAVRRFTDNGVARHFCNQRSHAGSDQGVVVDQ